MSDIIERAIPRNGLYIAGFADLSPCIPAKFRATPFALSIGRILDDGIIDGILQGPTREYFNHYHAVNRELAETARKAAEVIESAGARALVIEPTLGEEQIDEELRRALRYEFSHKMAATRAGLGWIGKTDLFVSEKFGPRLRLATVLTDRLAEKAGPPVDESRCGECTLCVESCPAGAANGKSWKAGVDRDEFFNAHRCRDYCRRVSKSRLDEDISLCGLCVAVCPVGG
jgi:epoxyqueuosine reductase QueG